MAVLEPTMVAQAGFEAMYVWTQSLVHSKQVFYHQATDPGLGFFVMFVIFFSV